MKGANFKPSPSPKGPQRAAAGNEIRIVGGAFRSRKVKFANAEGLRPTPDRVRETLFNWLGQTLHGKTVLDCFAGSGALGFEAASRGAKRVLMLELSRPVAKQLRQSKEVLGAGMCEVREADALAFLASCKESFDIVLLDPPFASDLLSPALTRVASLLAPGGCVYAESAHPVAHEQYVAARQSRAGAVHFALLQPASWQTPI